MKKRFLSVFVGFFFTCLFASILNAQTNETFNGSSLSSTWIGDITKFQVSEGKLQLNEEGNAGVAYLSTRSSVLDNASWEGTVHLSFTPSGTNYVRFYLVSDSPALNDNLSGYYLQIGNSKKQVLLYRIKGNSSKKLAESAELRIDTSSVTLSFKVIRNETAEWKVYTKLNDEPNFTEEFSVTDSTFTSSSFAGIYCKHTKTNGTKISWDNIIINGKSEIDNEAPQVTHFTLSDTLLTVQFNEWINTDFVELATNPIIKNSFSWNSAHTQLSVRLDEKLQNGQKYQLFLSNIKDFDGNNANDTTLNFAHIEEASTGDILFTEVLFVPKSEGSEFVEIYNCSNKIIDLSTLKFSTRKSVDSSLYSSKKIADETVLLFPCDIKVLTNNIAGIVSFYPCDTENFIQMSSFPSLRNETGAIVLFRSKDSLIIDNVYYENGMHIESVPDKGKGVSLERVSLETNEWTSAPEIAGYATPGTWKNGLISKKSDVDDIRFHSSELCQPYYDESKKFHLNYQFDHPNYQVTLRVYDLNGHCVKTILNNVTLEQEGDILWDGTNESGTIVPIAPYMIRLEAIQPQYGTRIKESFVVLVTY